MALSQSSSVLTSRPVPMVPTFSAPPSYNNIGPVFDSYSIETVPTYGPSLPFATDEDSKEQDIGWSDPQIDFPSPSQTGFTFGSVVAPSPIIDDDVPFENAHVRRDSGASLFNDLSDIDGDEEDEVGPGPDMDTDQAVNGLMTSNTQPLWFHQDPMGGEKDS